MSKENERFSRKRLDTKKETTLTKRSSNVTKTASVNSIAPISINFPVKEQLPPVQRRRTNDKSPAGQPQLFFRNHPTLQA